MRLVWIVEDYPVTGEFTDYARNWESANYSGIYVSSVVWVVEDMRLVEMPVAVNRDPNTYDDYVTYTLVVNGESAHVTIDGRA
jgi:hypothetical protein